MEQKTVIFAFRGDPMCFIHVLLNGLDLHEKGMGGEIVLEGEATKLVPELLQENHPLHKLYEQAKKQNLFVAVCKACSTKMGTIDVVEQQGLPVVGNMAGHPSMADYRAKGYQVVTL